MIYLIKVKFTIKLKDNHKLLENEKRVNNFVNNYLKQDGVFVLRMIALHTGIIFSSELVMHLYEMYYAIDDRIKV